MPSAPVMVEKMMSAIRLDALLAQAFPLFGPLHQREWAAGWLDRLPRVSVVSLCRLGEP